MEVSSGKDGKGNFRRWEERQGEDKTGKKRKKQGKVEREK